MRKLSFIGILLSCWLILGCGSGGGGNNQILDTGSSDNNSSAQNETNNPSPDTESTNAKPVAVIKGNTNAKPGQLVELSGSDSSDADEDLLTYKWSLIFSPTGSKATLSSINTPDTSITPDIDGLYRIQLIVKDGTVDSDPTTIDIIVSTPNSAPMANAGKDISVDVGSTVVLDGSASHDPDGDSLAYKWSFVSKPINSQAELLNTNSPSPTFVADQYTLTGNYVIQLVVSDGKVESVPDTVVITVPLSGIPPTTPTCNPPTSGIDMNQDKSAYSYIQVTWDAVSDSDLREYEIRYKKGISGEYRYAYTTGTTATFAPAIAGETYYLSVRSIDNQGNVSDYCTEQSIVAVADTTPPAIPIGVKLMTGASFDNNGVTYIWIKATWNQNSETDVVAYKLRIKAGIDGQYYYGTSDTNELTFVNVTPGTTFYIGVSAVDSSGNQSEYALDESIVSALDIVSSFELPPGENTIYLLESNFGGANEFVDLSIEDFNHQGAPLSIYDRSATATSTGNNFSTGEKSIIFTTIDSIGFGSGGITYTGRFTLSGYTTVNNEDFRIATVVNFENSNSPYVRFTYMGNGVYRVEADVYDVFGGTDGIDAYLDYDDLVFLIGPRSNLESFLGFVLP